MESQNILTKEGIINLKKELKELIKVQRPTIIQEIKEARAQGDLSENTEFDAAREKQGQIEDRISEIQNILASAKTIKINKNNLFKKVEIGSKVKYYDFADKTEKEVIVVGSLEVDPFENKISNNSPLGFSLLGLKEGDINIVHIYEKYEIKVLNITN